MYLTRTENVYRIDYDDKYTKKIEKLFVANKQKPYNYDLNNNGNGDLFDGVLKYSMENELPVSSNMDDNDHT